MAKEERRIAKEIVKLGKRSSNFNYIKTAKVAAKQYKLKEEIFPAEKKLTTLDGLEAYINLDQNKLIHEVKSDLVLRGIPIKKSNNPYLKGSQQLILKMPLDSNEVKKRSFLTKASKHFKDSVKFNEVKDGKVYEITHRSKQGKRRELLSEYKERNNWIKKRIDELRNDSNSGKINVIFRQVGREASEKFTCCKFLKERSLSPSTVRNIYYSK